MEQRQWRLISLYSLFGAPVSHGHPYNRSMRLFFRIVVAAFGIMPLVAAASAGSLSLCQQLATHVRKSAPAVLRSGRSLKPWVELTDGGDPNANAWGAREAAANAILRHALEANGSASAFSVVDIGHLPGTQVYMGSTVAGSADCQTSIFAEIDSSGTGRILPRPVGYTGPCWNVQGSLGTVLGHPAYVELGTLSMTTDDMLVRVTPWTGRAWGPVCQLTIKLNYELRLGRQFCGNQPVCRAASAIATDVAREYEAFSSLPSSPMRAIAPDSQVPDFSYQHRDTVASEGFASVTRAWHVLARQAQAKYPGAGLDYAVDTSVFPTFGERGAVFKYSYSYGGFALFPLMLDGRLYVGAVGHNGVGWREGTHILFAVYEVPARGQNDLIPLAGFSIDRVPDGLNRAEVETGRHALLPNTHQSG